jgi:acetyl esterase
MDGQSMSSRNRDGIALAARAAAAAIVILLPGLGTMAREEADGQSRYVYKTIGERKLTIDFDYPPGWERTDKRPAIVFFFGGGWTKGSLTQFEPQAEYFAKRGLVCGRADYRVRGKDGVTPDKCVEDALSAMRWVRGHAAQLGTDPDRIVAAGGSAGGHLAACTFFIEDGNAGDGEKPVSPKPNVMVLYNPALNLAALPGKANEKFVEGMSQQARERNSPLLYLRKDAPRTLVLDGTKDWLGSQTKEFVEKSKALGVPVEVYYAEGQPHSFFNKDPWLAKTTERVDQFLCEVGYLDKEPKVPLPVRGEVPKKAGRGKQKDAKGESDSEAL